MSSSSSSSSKSKYGTEKSTSSSSDNDDIDRRRSRSRTPPAPSVPIANRKKFSIQMRVKSNNSGEQATIPKKKVKSITVASVFNQDSDEEPEQMPPEARMRMRNIGRDTPTSSGPNSFGKTKYGFSDANKVYERNIRQATEAVSADGAAVVHQRSRKL